jgi:hypothetical protein
LWFIYVLSIYPTRDALLWAEMRDGSSADKRAGGGGVGGEQTNALVVMVQEAGSRFTSDFDSNECQPNPNQRRSQTALIQCIESDWQND